MTKSTLPEGIKGFECRFSVYCPPPEPGMPDYHFVKEVTHHTDGTVTRGLRGIRDYKRPFWVTKKGARNHKDKKEWEHLENLELYTSTQTNLIYNAARALGQPGYRGDLRTLANSPYLYGTDLLSTAAIKRSYQDKFPELLTPATNAVIDTETDMLHGTEEIVMCTLTMKDKVFTVVKNSFLQGRTDVKNQLHGLLKLHLQEHVTQRGIQWEVVFVEREVDTVLLCLAKAHEWKPDFLSIWNMDFDIPKMLRALEKAGIDPAQVFSDPSVPKEYRHFRYKKGPSQKVTASGLVTPIKPAARWHTVYCPASFYVIDAMCAYRHIRTGSAEETSYSLDAILKKHGLDGKLNFDEAEGMTGADWHIFMQDKYPLEYIIYNVFDCVAMEILDEIINDLSVVLPMFSGCSDFENFKSQPRRLVDSLHYFCLQEKRMVIASTSKDMKVAFDSETIGLDEWIVTLPAHLVIDDGARNILEDKWLRTNIRAHVGDLDVTASYPNGGCVFNISKETTARELISIEGVSETVRRAQGTNLSGGHTNAVEIVCGLYGLPSLRQLAEAFEEELALTV